MRPEDFALLNDFFDQAVQSDDPQKFVDSLDLSEHLRQRLQKLVASHNQAGDFLSELQLTTMMVDRVTSLISGLGPGEVLGDFKLEEQIGKGAFGTVFAATQQSLGRRVALKVTPDVGFEAQTMAKLEHECIVPIFSESIVKERKLRLICMPLIPCVDFARVLAELRNTPVELRDGKMLVQIVDRLVSSTGDIDPGALQHRLVIEQSDYTTACLRMLLPVARGLAFAHSRGVLHLDVKPGNVLVDIYGRTKLADFNVAGTTAQNFRLLGGTRGFMSPEQALAFENPGAAQVDHRSDIYSFGRLILNLLLPDEADFDLESANKIDDPTLRGLVLDCLEHEKDMRVPSANRVADGLDNCILLRERRRALKPLPKLLGLLFGSPLWVLGIAAIIPQILGSIINISYNYQEIVTQLNPAQRTAFFDVLGPYNAVMYPLCFLWIMRRIWLVVEDYRAGEGYSWRTADFLQSCRKRMVRLPRQVVLLCTLGWLPGAILFPVLIGIISDPVPSHVYARFAVSFVTSWLIASTYSYFLVLTFLMRMLYPQLWSPYTEIAQANDELRPFRRSLNFGLYAASAVPLSAALMVLVEDAGDQSWQLRAIVAALIVIGILGFTITFQAVDYLKSVINRFTDRSGEV